MLNKSTDSAQKIERKAIEMNQLLNKLKQKLESAKTNKTQEINYMNIIDELKVKVIEIERENKELKSTRDTRRDTRDIETEQKRTFYDLNDLRNENMRLKKEIETYTTNNNNNELHKKYLQLLKDKENELQSILKNTNNEKLAINNEKMLLCENQQNVINELQKSMVKHQKEIQELESNMKIKQNEEKIKYEERVSKVLNEKRNLEMKINEIEEYNRITINEKQMLEMKISEIEECNSQLLEENIKIKKIVNKLNNELIDLKGKIRVFCKIKPITGDFRCKYNFSMTENTINIEKNIFDFHKIFDFGHNQMNVYSEVAFLIQSLFNGYNATIFAYGQTGSGKTYTMEGNDSDKGIILQAIDQIYTTVEQMQKEGYIFDISIDFVEIYNESIIDLLYDVNIENKEIINDQKINSNMNERTRFDDKKYNTYNIGKSTIQKQNIDIIHDNKKTHLKNCKNIKVETKTEALNVFNIGVKNRTVGFTNCNERSSRSHSIFRVNLQISNEKETINSVLSFIDLAGSERLYLSCSEGIRLKETQNINKSLSALSNVINAIAKKEPHVPYRDSKLTYFLQNSLSGNSRILMFVNISPELNHLNETLCSLRFAQKVSECALGTIQKNVQKRL
ncbi:hypothetical protein BDAP_001423 [Binucleata daphniae]